MPSSDYELLYPPHVVFGDGAIERLPEFLPAGRHTILLVTGRHFADSGERDQIVNLLKDHHVIPVTDIPPEPPLSAVDALLEVCRGERVSAVVGVGGGSVLDVAKTVAALAPLEGMTADYFYGSRDVQGPGLPFIAAPTTAGTGAEITKNAVLIDTATKVKKSIKHACMIPTAAIIDPVLTLSCPPSLTAASGLDAFTQAVESYITDSANAATRALAAAAVGLIYNNLKIACDEPDNLDTRRKVAEGSVLSAMSFSQCGLGAVHGLAHPIGSILGLSHGLSCAILLLPVLQWNMRKKQEDYASLAKVCGGNLPDDFITSTRSLLKALKIPRGFAEFGLKKEHFPFVIENCRSGSMAANPRSMSDSDVEDMLVSVTI